MERGAAALAGRKTNWKDPRPRNEYPLLLTSRLLLLLLLRPLTSQRWTDWLAYSLAGWLDGSLAGWLAHPLARSSMVWHPNIVVANAQSRSPCRGQRVARGAPEWTRAHAPGAPPAGQQREPAASSSDA